MGFCTAQFQQGTHVVGGMVEVVEVVVTCGVVGGTVEVVLVLDTVVGQPGQ